MAEPNGDKKKAKTARTDSLTIRLDPRLRYLADLAARKQRRSLTSLVEWALEEALKNVVLSERDDDTREPATSVAEEGRWLWDVDDADRFARLAISHQELLTHEEQKLWKLIRANGHLWKGRYQDGEWTWNLYRDSFCFERLREHWETFNAVARGEQPTSKLPTWKKTNPSAPDDDIPF